MFVIFLVGVTLLLTSSMTPVQAQEKTVIMATTKQAHKTPDCSMSFLPVFEKKDGLFC